MVVKDRSSILKKLQDQMNIHNIDVMLLNSPDAILYCTGFASQTLYCTSKLGGTLAVVPKTGACHLIVSDFERLSAMDACDDSVKISSYPVWIYIEDMDDGKEKCVQPNPNTAYRMAVETIRELHSPQTLAIQMDETSVARWNYLHDSFPNGRLVDAASALIEAKAIKTSWEIDTLRQNTRILERVMFDTYHQVKPGMNEKDVFSIWNRACFNASDEVYGTSNTNMFGEFWSPNYIPDEKKIVCNGDILRLDGVVWRNGYGSDIGRASAVGGKASSPEMDEIYAGLYAGYSLMVKMIGPGVRMCDVFNQVMEEIHKYLPAYRRGHIGHSLGCNRYSEEYPFISPSEERIFEPGMVLCTELPYYSSKHNSYILEDTLCVTENGIELFCHVPKTLSWEEII